ncbi:MAG: hypothetical protein L0154_21100 [Chloroflexi bacterium]|nr:hypothetical protein [Chloroflexota bacterium]
MYRKLIWLVLVMLLIAAPVLAQGGIDDERRAQMMAVEQQVIALRELAPAENIERLLVNEAELEGLVLGTLLSEYTVEQAHDEVLFYATLGFMDRTVNLHQITQDVSTEQVAGFYDTEQDLMYVMMPNNEFDTLTSIIYAHEYTHALQDQNFDLDSLISDEIFDAEPDYALANLALIEGDAQLMTLLYTEWLLENDPGAATSMLAAIDSVEMSALEGAPDIIEAELIFPYDAGLRFAQALYEENGWRILDKVYNRPPLSTEQILHPDLYLLYEEPQVVELASLDDFFVDNPTWTLVRSHALGEFYITEHLKVRLPANEAQLAAEGWGGDRFDMYVNGNEQVVVAWKLVWDTPEDMDEFNMAYNVFAATWTGSRPEIFDNNVSCWWTATFTVCKTTAGEETLISIALTTDMARGIIDFQLENVVQQGFIFG